MKVVIRAGGAGSRLWPVSRLKKPKQFQCFVGNNTLLQDTFERVMPLCSSIDDIFISVHEDFTNLALSQIDSISKKNLIIEPISMNTGAGICLESCILARLYSEDEIVASLASDAYIKNNDAFFKMIKESEKCLLENPDKIITPGSKMDFPDTGYSYIQSGEPLNSDDEYTIYSIKDWIEKPFYELCKKLIQDPSWYAHTGMYIWKLKEVLKLFEKYHPFMLIQCKKIANLIVEHGYDLKREEIFKLYSEVEKLSVEKAITNNANNLMMIKSDNLGWSDLGKWHVIKNILQESDNQNVIKGNVIHNDSKDNIIYSDSDFLVSTIGLNNMIVIQSGNSILVCPKEKSEEITKIVDQLKEEKKEKYL